MAGPQGGSTAPWTWLSIYIHTLTKPPHKLAVWDISRGDYFGRWMSWRDLIIRAFPVGLHCRLAEGMSTYMCQYIPSVTGLAITQARNTHPPRQTLTYTHTPGSAQTYIRSVGCTVYIAGTVHTRLLLMPVRLSSSSPAIKYSCAAGRLINCHNSGGG